IDVDAQLRLRRLEVRIDVDYAWNRAHLVHQLYGVLLQLFDVRSLNQDVQAIEASAAALTATAARAPTAGGRTGDVGAARDADADAELALVVVGYELLADVRIKERGGERDGAGDADHHRTMAQRPMEHLAVDRIQPGIPAGGLRRRVIGLRVLLAEPR